MENDDEYFIGKDTDTDKTKTAYDTDKVFVLERKIVPPGGTGLDVAEKKEEHWREPIVQTVGYVAGARRLGELSRRSHQYTVTVTQ